MSAPIEPAFKDLMNVLAYMLDETFNGAARGMDRKVGFTLLTFNFSNKSRVNYISNADPADILATMKAFIAHAEGRVIDPPEQTQ